MSAAKKISVIMPVYNGQKYLEEAIKSMFAQSYEDFELLVVDDGSRDDSLAIVQSFSDERIKLITNEQNLGVARSLNKAIRLSCGEYIARMDADDIARPNRLEKQLAYLEKNCLYSFVGSWVHAFGEQNTVFQYPVEDELIQVSLLFYPCFCHPAVMWRKEDFVKNDFWYQEDPPTAEDYDLWVRVAEKLKMSNLPEVLLDYRIDMQVKHTSYLTQQTEGNWMVKQFLLRSLGLKVEAKYKQTLLNYAGVEIEHNQERGHLLEFLDILASISRNNSRLGKYNQYLLDQRLRDGLYGFFCRNQSLSWKDWFAVRFSSESFPSIKLTMKMLLKRMAGCSRCL